MVTKTSNQEKTDKTKIDYLCDAIGLVSKNNDIALLDHLGTPTTLMNNNDITTQGTFNDFGVGNDIQDKIQ